MGLTYGVSFHCHVDISFPNISGLSATIGSPEHFNRWLASVQIAHGYEHTFVEHPYRYSHLRKFYYLIDGEGTFTSLTSHQISQRARFLHPISLLAFGIRPLPPDLALESRDTLSLFRALSQFQSVIPQDLRSLEPITFFSNSTFLRQKDVLRYESELKVVLSDLIRYFNPQDESSPLRGVINALQDPEIIKLDPKSAYAKPSRNAFKNDLIILLADLHKKEELVCSASPIIRMKVCDEPYIFSRVSCSVLIEPTVK